MELEFANDRLARDMQDDRRASKTWGADRAFALRKRLDDLFAAPTLEHMRNLTGRCEELRGDRSGSFSVRLDKNYRLIFVPANEPVPFKLDGGIDWLRVTRIRMLEVVDYHG